MAKAMPYKTFDIPIKPIKETFMKNITIIVSKVTLVSIICFALFASLQTKALAKTITPLEGVKFDTSSPMRENLMTYIGKDVIIHLRSEKSLQGYVKSVGTEFVHLEKLAGRDFYDALIRIEDISALEVKFRDMK
jgi:hypothetical protein